MINPSHICVVHKLVQFLKTAGAINKDIAILTTYKAQLRLYRAIPDSAGINMGTVDGSQGREYPYMILDLVSHGALKAVLRLTVDVKRVFVALSRAQHGLIIVGNSGMGENAHQSLGVRSWISIIKHHRRQRALVARNPDQADVTNLMEVHQIPGTLYRREVYQIPEGGVPA